MEPVRHSKSVFETECAEPFLPVSQCVAVRSFCHEEDPGIEEAVFALQLKHFCDVLRIGNHEFEECAGVVCKGFDSLRDQRQFRAVAGMRKLGADIELISPDVEPRGRLHGAVGFNLDIDVGQMLQHVGQRPALQQWFTPGDDQPVLAERADLSGGFFSRQRDLVRLAVISDAVPVRAFIPVKMPCVRRIAPCAGEVTAGQTYERDRHSRAGPFALQAGEDFWAAIVIGGKS